MEKYEGKDILRKCAWCKDWLEDYEKPDEQVEQNIAVISHGCCEKCLETLYPDMCKDDNLTLLK